VLDPRHDDQRAREALLRTQDCLRHIRVDKSNAPPHIHHHEYERSNHETPHLHQRPQRRAQHRLLPPHARHRTGESPQRLREVRYRIARAESRSERSPRPHQSRRSLPPRHPGELDRRRPRDAAALDRSRAHHARRDEDRLLLRDAGQNVGHRSRRQRMGSVRRAHRQCPGGGKSELVLRRVIVHETCFANRRRLP
jgi:hypothetical protein